MNNFKIKKIIGFIIVVLILSSCKTFYPSMSNALKRPEQNKTVNLQIVSKSGMPELPKKYIESDLKTNVINTTQTDVLGKIEIGGNLKSYKDPVSVFFSSVTLGILSVYGLPLYGGNVKLKDFTFSIKDDKNNVVKNYSYTSKKSYARGLYYGMDNKEAQIVVSKRIMNSFKMDLRKDVLNINKQLDSVYYTTHQRPVKQQPIATISDAEYAQNEMKRLQAELAETKNKKEIEELKAQLADAKKNAQAIPKYQFQKLSDVDNDIPESTQKNANTFALIIANEDYTFLGKVDYAQNDGEAFKEHCIKTLGIPEKQVWFYSNASAGIVDGGISKLVYALNNFEGAKAIVYYCGHGIPDEKTGDAFLAPTDASGTNMATCRSLSTIYKTLSATKASQITYFMDACFTGANKEGTMLIAARGVAREAKKETLEGNTVVFSAATGDETAMAYPEKHHGLFTYFLLKKLQETKGNVSYEELSNYIKDNVKREAFLTNEKPQNPMVATSLAVEKTWKTMRFW